MEYIYSIIAGVIQGVTEFLPVSSSGHLILFHQIFNFDIESSATFDVMLHLGTFFSLLIFFYRDIMKVIRGFLSSLTNWNLTNNFNQRLSWLIIISAIPAFISGYFFQDFIESRLRSVLVVGVMMILVAIVLLVVEKRSSRSKDLQQMSKMDAFIIGLSQILAFFPGTSRSGITIIAGMARKLKREDAARFSFLLSAPVIFGASVKTILDGISFSGESAWILFFGFFASFISGYFVIKYFLKYVSNHSLNVFAYYRLIIGCLALIWFIFLSGR